MTGGKYQVRFPRDAKGRFCPPSPSNPNPDYAPLRPKPSYKYTQQARFCLGVVAVKTKDGRIIGRRSAVFDYTGQRLISIAEYKRRMKEEMQRVRNLAVTGRRSKWVTNTRDKNRFHDNDSISHLPRVGYTKTYDKMISHGIRTILDLKNHDPDQVPPVWGVRLMHRDALTRSLPGFYPTEMVDHRQAQNPYESKYGDEWEERLKRSSALSPFRPISDLVDFVAEESHRLMQGTCHEDD